HARLTVTFPALAVGAFSAGVGFTVSLLVATLAFDGAQLEEAKIGVLFTAIIAPISTWVAAWVFRQLPDELRARQLSATAATIVDLDEDVDPERDHIRGNLDAPVTLLEYGDFECPYCGHAAPTIAMLLESFPDDLRYVWRHLPLTDVHPNGQMAAEAAEAAGAQGRFWDMHDRLLEHQDELAPIDLYGHATALGLDLDRFKEDVWKRRFAARVAEDVQSADASGVSGTPTFFINGRRHYGVYDIDTLRQALKNAARAPRRSGTPVGSR